MSIRHAIPADLPELMQLFEGARQFMAATGNPNQWPPTYPGEERLLADMALGHSYVLEEEGRILASFYFAVEKDPTYQVITEGQWKSDAPYAVIHRIAVSDHRKGVAAQCVQWCAQQHASLRIDTHHDNTVMQRFLKKQGFLPAGIIFLPNGAPRIAYERFPGIQ